MSATGELCRLRVRYKKDGRLAYLGHLEVMGTVMRSVRRSGIPFEVSTGFARRMRIQFCQALPVGASSIAEYFDLLTFAPLDAEEALDVLRGVTPSALAPSEAIVLPRRMPALEAWANRAQWDVVINDPDVTMESFAAGMEALLAKGVLEFMRGPKRRKLDLGPTLVSWNLSNCEEGLHLTLDTRSTEQGSLRPAVLVQAITDRPPLRVLRVGQYHEEPDGTLTNPIA